jgi:undecaprenyl-diphosphatase
VSAAPTTINERSELLLLAILTLVPFTALAFWAATLSPAPWEPDVLHALETHPGFVGTISAALNTLGNLPFWAVVVGVAAAGVSVVHGIRAGVLVALSFASDLAAFVVKVLVERDRPDTAAVQQFFGADNFSYPSGHTVRAAALVGVVIWFVAPRRYRLPLAILGGLIGGAIMGYARVSLGVHWPTDVIGGTLLGLGWFCLTTLAIGFDEPAERNRTKR